MKGVMVLVGTLRGKPAAARIIDGELDDLLVDINDKAPAPGSVYRAVCDRPMKGQGGMFLSLGGGLKGYLRQAKGLAPGDTFLVQVTGYAEEGKAVPVTPKVLFKSRYAIMTPGAPGLNVARSIRDDEERERILGIAHDVLPELENMGVILRSSCSQADADALAEDIETTYDLAISVMSDEGSGPECLLDGPEAYELAWREWSTPKPDEVREGVDELDGWADQAFDAKVPLSSGFMYVEPTRALVAVDVNTGGDSSPAAGLKANIAAARALPRALRVRGLAGQVVIDLAPMAKKERRTFESVLRSAFRQCPVETTLVDWTPLGHFELNRKRERLPLKALKT